MPQTVPHDAHTRSIGPGGDPAARRYVDAAPVRAHLALLAQARMSRTEIAALTGASRLTLVRVERGDLTQVTPATAQAILAVPPAALASQQHGWVEATGTRRRLQALAAGGWPTSELAARLHTSQSGVRRLLEDGHLCSAATRARVIELYDELWDRPAPPSKASRIARRRAQARRWWPPLAWDDDTIDDPTAAPANPTPGPLWAQRVENIEWLLATSEVLATVCARLGVGSEALQRQLRLHQRLDLWVRLVATEADWHARSKLAA